MATGDACSRSSFLEKTGATAVKDSEEKRAADLSDLPMGIVPVAVVERRPDEAGQCIHVFPEFEDALDGVEDLEHLTILYWMHRFGPEDRRRLRVHPRGDRSQPRKGVFALRSPLRPNPIGVTTARLLRRDGLDLYVEGLDAVDGSPVIDIKYGRVE